MDIIIRFLAFNNTKELKTQSEKIIALSSCGLTPSEIADISQYNSKYCKCYIVKSKEKRF